MRVYKQRFIKFINDKYGSGLIGNKATNVIIDEYAFAGPFEGEEE